MGDAEASAPCRSRGWRSGTAEAPNGRRSRRSRRRSRRHSTSPPRALPRAGRSRGSRSGARRARSAAQLRARGAPASRQPRLPSDEPSPSTIAIALLLHGLSSRRLNAVPRRGLRLVVQHHLVAGHLDAVDLRQETTGRAARCRAARAPRPRGPGALRYRRRRCGRARPARHRRRRSRRRARPADLARVPVDTHHRRVVPVSATTVAPVSTSIITLPESDETSA